MGTRWVPTIGFPCLACDQVVHSAIHLFIAAVRGMLYGVGHAAPGGTGSEVNRLPIESVRNYYVITM